MRHPLHATLAHFPVACWSLATIADIASPRFGPTAWHFAGMLLWVGTVVAVPTILVGIVELVRIPREPASVRAGFLHMGVMLVAFLLYVASLLLSLHEGNIIDAGTAGRTMSVIGFAFLLVGGWLGGSLVYGYGAGGDRARGSSADAERST